ncbi:MAG: molybdopterin-dependent oxidoreductase [Cellulosilyticaceae bacterium]
MIEQSKVLEETLENRVSMYGLMQAVFGEVPSRDLLDQLGETELLEDVKSEYMRLLVGPGGLKAYPWGSTYLDVEKMLFGESTAAVRRTYEAYGFVAHETLRVAEDHVAIELRFMMQMSLWAQEALANRDEDRMQYYLEGQRRFIREHMMLWVPQYAEAMVQIEGAKFYPKFAQDVVDFLGQDLDYLERVCTGERATEDEGEYSEQISDEGKWVSAACWHNCGGRCVNKVLIKEGAVVRQKTDDSHDDSYEYPQQRACVRGHAQQQQCFGADRIKYPMKRKHWEPITGGNKALRGQDEWEIITWDEAFRLVAAEFRHIKENYGNRAFLETGWGAKNSAKVLNLYGGHTWNWDTSSYGSYLLGLSKIGLPPYGQGTANDRFDLLNAETIVLHGSNPAWSAAGNPAFLFYKAYEQGAKFVVIGPDYNASAQLYDAKWLRVRTGTDTAFLLGVTYEMLRLDEAGEDLIDWAFLHKYSIGFDAESMPKDAKTNENFKDYVLGKYDNIPKTPEWASEICGTPVEDITWYARTLTKHQKVMLLFTYGAARNNGAENLPQLFHTIGMMGGHAGKSGHAIGSSYARHAGNTGPLLVGAGDAGLPTIPNTVDDAIPAPQVWTAVLGGQYRYVGDVWFGGLKQGEEREIDIRCIFHDASAYLQTGMNMTGGIMAHRQVDFVVSKAQFYNTQAKYSDIILPVTTEWETVGGFSAGNREMIVCYEQVTPPLFEAKTDQEIDCGIAKALGLNPQDMYPISEKQQFFNKIAGCWYRDDKGNQQTLVTITPKDIRKWECEGTPQGGIITIDELLERGGYQVPRHQGDAYGFIGWEDFVRDPKGHPLPSASGKFEIYSQAKADELNGLGFDTVDYKPYPHYIVPKVGYETTFRKGDIKGEKGEYPYLLFNPHYLRRSHGVFDNCPWLRESWPNPVFLNAQDASSKGIQNGDTVLVYNAYGKVLRQAALLETLMPGIVGIPHGSWVDMDEKTGIDKGGADNILVGPVVAGMGISGYNNFNCNFEKYEGDAITPDYLKP